MRVFEQGRRIRERWSAEKIALSMLLEPKDLHEDRWVIIGEKTWLTGTRSNEVHVEGFVEARSVGSITAWRLFKLDLPIRNMLLRVASWGSEEHAEAAIPMQRSIYTANPNFTRSILSEVRFDDRSIEDLSNTIVYEQSTLGGEGSGMTWYIAGNVDKYVLSMSCSRRGNDWSWSEVAHIVSLQAQKLRDITNHSI